MELESALGRKVDLVTYRSISPHFQEAIMNEQITIL
jgi:predicted nucleotidyltransferase